MRFQKGVSVFVGVVLLGALVGPAHGQPQGSSSQIGPDAVRRVKQATVYLKVDTSDGQTAEGSGFLAVERGIVITNAHVLGMLQARSKPPRRIGVVAHSGEKDEKEMAGKVLAIDRVSDIAVLRIDGELPPPLALEIKDEPFETQKVYIFGFPFGAELGKNVTVSESSISSLRRNTEGTLERIQVNGGMHPGNSGGPVVNADGKVVGVAVAAIRGSQINFAIPASAVKSAMDGRLGDVKAGQLFQQDGELRVPLRCQCLDPLRHVREVQVEAWAGAAAKERKYSSKGAETISGDGPRQSTTLTLTNGVASGDARIPAVASGQVAWVQAVAVFANGEKQWGQPRSFDPGMAVTLDPADLSFALKDQKERTIHMKSVQSVSLSSGGRKLYSADTAELDVLESFGPNPKGASIRTAFANVNLRHEEDGAKSIVAPQVVTALQRIPPTFVIDETNKLRERSSTELTARVSPVLREEVNNYVAQFCNTYEAANFVLPNRKMNPRATWVVQQPMLIKTKAKPIVVDLVMTCRYEGTRGKSEEKEAVVSFEGMVQGRNELKDSVGGQIEGKFVFSPRLGFISDVKMKISSEASVPGAGYFFNWEFDIDMVRSAGNARGIELPKRGETASTSPESGGRTPRSSSGDTTTAKSRDFPFKGLFTKPEKSENPTSYMKIDSPHGDYIGQGKSYEYTGDKLTFRRTPRGLRISVDGWNFDVGAPNGMALKVGEYPNAKRFAFSGDSPGLDFRGKGRGSNTLSGEFAVWQLEWKENQIGKLAIDFVQRSDNGKPLTGKIRFNSTFE